ncbi:MAG: serine hydrolase [Bacteroidales bacterium]|nr:serine hydrolase [Bacteroidales bacterium]
MKGNFRKGLIILFAAIITGVFLQFSIDNRSFNEQEFIFRPSPPPFLNDTSRWVDSVFLTLSVKEKIGQLFMVAAYPENGKADVDRVTMLIKKYNVGGIIFFQGKPERIAELTKYYQSVSKVPLLFAFDGEWGLSMRFDNTIEYPKQMMLGAITDDDIIYQMGRDIAKQMKLIGLHINFAPVVDINNNPDNPVINTRSFGEQRENVARKGILYMRGLQDEGIIAVAKHFPGHGDTDVDSHYDLPVIRQSRSRLDSIELFPFRALIEGGVGGIMTAHLNVPALDNTANMPSSLSAAVTDSLLRGKYEFKGLIFTDAMNMMGVSANFEPEVANCMALQAGNDILLMPSEEKRSVRQIEKLIKKQELDIDDRCKKILQAKEWVLKEQHKRVSLDKKELTDSLNSPVFEINRRKLIEKALTIVEDKERIIPFINLSDKKFAAVSLGDPKGNEYQNTLSKYTYFDLFKISGDEDSAQVENILNKLIFYDYIFLSIHSNDIRANRQFGISDRLLKIADRIIYRCPTVLNAFSNPYLLGKLNNLSYSKVIVVSYDNDPVVQSLSAQMLFGAVDASGKLPVGINEQYTAGTGSRYRGKSRLKYTIPLEAGLDAGKLSVIDSLVNDAITKKAMPGCQILVARYGKVVYQKSYGYHTYNKRIPVEDNDLYDLASITKIVATLPSVMLLDQQGYINIQKPLANYLPELDTTNKAEMIIRDILTHQAGLKAWIPFYRTALEPLYPNQKVASNKFSKRYPYQIGNHYFINKHLKYVDSTFSRTRSDLYSVEVAEGLYMNPILIDSIYLKIYASEMDEPGEYKYSDLGFYLFQRMIERQTHKPLDRFVDSCFYQPLGTTTLGYHPLERFSKDRIAPTENDMFLRRQVVHGYVHDPGAAMLGGVAGHAGLFSNANDLAKYMQMLMNEGTYGGKEYIGKKLIRHYTSCQDCDNGNRRGLGFDKPEIDTTKNGPAFRGISTNSYGHTGFTGTMVWADPETGILFIFLSNRVYPEAFNNKLIEMDVRTNIQRAIYDAIIE